MIVLDSYAVLALLKDEPAADQVGRLLGSEDASLTALGAAEVLDHLIRLVGADEDEAVLDLAQLGLLPPSPVDGPLGIRSSLLRARHYHRQHRAVSLADCVAAETARGIAAPLASADPHILDVCRDEGIQLIALTDTRGRRWLP